MTKLNNNERLAVLETKLDDACDKINDIKVTNVAEHQEIKTIISDFIKQADKRYAPFWIATLIYFIIGGMLLYIAQQILDHLIN